jgi:RNA polymerase sigma-70 factor (ECF subfamily)
MVAVPYPPTLASIYTEQNFPACASDEGNQARLEVFNSLVLAHQDAVFQQALWIMGDEDAAEDATQEAFLRAYRKMDSFNGGPFKPWIMKIATNYCLDQLRRQKRRVTVPLEPVQDDGEAIEEPAWLVDPEMPVETLVEQSEARARIRKCINRLPLKYRTAVILVDIQELDYQEAASAMGIHMGTFKSRLCRARKQLQQWLATDQKTYCI